MTESVFKGCGRLDRISIAGILLFLSGFIALTYGIGINLQGMMARGATNYTGISFFIVYWSLLMLAGLVLAVGNLVKR